MKPPVDVGPVGQAGHEYVRCVVHLICPDGCPGEPCCGLPVSAHPASESQLKRLEAQGASIEEPDDDDAPTPPTPAGTHTLACAVAEHERTPGSSAKCACWCHATPAGEEAQFCDDCEITHPCEFHVRPPATPEADGGLRRVIKDGLTGALAASYNEGLLEAPPGYVDSSGVTAQEYRAAADDFVSRVKATLDASPSPSDGAEELRAELKRAESEAIEIIHDLHAKLDHERQRANDWMARVHAADAAGSEAESALADALLLVEFAGVWQHKNTILSRQRQTKDPEAIAAYKRISERRRA